MRPRALVGTSGWNYKHWRGIVYPGGLAQSNWLRFCAERLDTVEVNTSFYRIPAAETVKGWQAAVRPGFRFALKLWRGITHYRKLVAAEDLTRRFLEAVSHLGAPYRAPVLIQLPPNQGKDTGKLRAYLEEWRARAGSGWQVAVEFRNDAWLDAGTYRVLDGAGAALCLHDMQGFGAVEVPNEVPFVYLRRHGSLEGRYAGSYAPEQLAREAARVASWVRSGRTVYVYFNNDIGGHAFWNALDLRARLRDMIVES